MWGEGQKLSVSLITVELVPEGGKTRLIHTEQGSYFIGGQEAVKSREQGTTWHIEGLRALFDPSLTVAEFHHDH